MLKSNRISGIFRYHAISHAISARFLGGIELWNYFFHATHINHKSSKHTHLKTEVLVRQDCGMDVGSISWGIKDDKKDAQKWRKTKQQINH